MELLFGEEPLKIPWVSPTGDGILSEPLSVLCLPIYAHNVQIPRLVVG